LGIEYCSLHSAAAIPSIATLTRLTKLIFGISNAAQEQHRDLPLGQEELQLLRSLRRLKTLNNGGLFTNEAVRELWDKERGEWRHQQP
jgi:hypothetical protein